jgi:hypothetical protein
MVSPRSTTDSDRDPWPRVAYVASFLALALIVVLLGLDLTNHKGGSTTPMPRGDVAIGTAVHVTLGQGSVLVDLEQILDSPPPASVSTTPTRTGYTVYAVKLSIMNEGQGSLTVKPSEYLIVTNANGSIAVAGFDSRSDCQPFPNSTVNFIPSSLVHLEPDEVAAGCIAFEEPDGAKPWTVSLGSAQWFVGS